MDFGFLKLLKIFRKKKSSTLSLGKEQKRKLTKLLGYKITDESFYIKALIHRSYLELSSAQIKSNERLEFLGDSVLNLITAEFLFKKFPNEKEGFLTKIRSHLVDTSALIKTSVQMELPEVIFYDKRFLDSFSIGIQKISADAVEALIAAVYLDKGIQETQKFVKKWIIKPNLKSGEYKIDTNYKGQLLELTHAKQLGQPIYFVLNENGPEHDKTFDIGVKINNKIYGIGIGHSKKSAEQRAAKKAIKKINPFSS